jgi:Ca2+-binding EF-hand superfamily protein
MLGNIAAFKIIDRDNDQVISYEDFVNALRNLFNLKLNNNEMQLYYAKLP